MVRITLKKRRRKKAPAIVHYTSETNDRGHKQICVIAECGWSNQRVGPIWGHTDAAVKRALATLSQQCECPARFHSKREVTGKRVV